MRGGDDPHREQEQLILIHPFSLRAVTPTQQLFQQVLQLLEPPLLGVHLLQEGRHHLPQGGHVFRQLVAINLHGAASRWPAPVLPTDPPTR